MQSPVASLLKSRTAAAHERVETMLDLVDDTITVDRMLAILRRFAGFWPVNERAIDAWAQANPALAAGFSWPRRRRTAILQADLLVLGLTHHDLTGLPEASAVFPAVSEANVLGWLYVSEGSTLGGAVIDRALRRHGAAQFVALRTFTPYPEGPGPMWRSYLDALARWVGDDAARSEAVVTAAQHSFAALADWLEPVAAEVAA